MAGRTSLTLHGVPVRGASATTLALTDIIVMHFGNCRLRCTQQAFTGCIDTIMINVDSCALAIYTLATCTGYSKAIKNFSGDLPFRCSQLQNARRVRIS